MEIKEQIRLRFVGVDFPSVQFSSEQSYIEGNIEDLVVKIEPKAFLPQDISNEFQIIMQVEISVKDYFSLKIIAVGVFRFSSEEEVPSEIRKSFINANSTAIMFPYVRSFVSTFTANLGGVMNPIVLPTRFFKGDMEEITPVQTVIDTNKPVKKAVAKKVIQK